MPNDAIKISMDTLVSFPENTCAVMVLKNYADRVVDFLRSNPRCDALGGHLYDDDKWISCTKALHSASALEIPETLASAHAISKVKGIEGISASETATTISDVRILDIQALTGVSQALRGYFLVLVPKARRSIEELSPMARQNIAWIGSVQHCYQYSDDEYGLARLCQKTWASCQAHGFDCNKHLMRIECHPRHLLEPFCLALQIAAAAAAAAAALSNDKKQDSKEPTDPFEGLIAMTVSKSKCTHLLTIILVRNAKNDNIVSEKNAEEKLCDKKQYETVAPTSTTACWGLDDRRNPLLSVKLNQDASQEIIIRPCNNQTREESTWKDKVDPRTPLSRAYYKLEQVWTDFLKPLGDDLLSHLRSGAAVDLGASPGGWTQVLAHSVCLPVVVAVDPAKLASRVLQLPNVCHVASSLETTNYRKSSSGLPYTMLVCDASTLWLNLLEKVQKDVLKCADWSLPAVFVITLKLPFKTLGSIRRQLEQIYQDTPSILTKMASDMYPSNNRVECYFQIVHLMANSVSERTLIAVFDDDRDSRSRRKIL